VILIPDLAFLGDFEINFGDFGAFLGIFVIFCDFFWRVLADTAEEALKDGRAVDFDCFYSVFRCF
jgi:hypothetical protein